MADAGRPAQATHPCSVIPRCYTSVQPKPSDAGTRFRSAWEGLRLQTAKLTLSPNDDQLSKRPAYRNTTARQRTPHPWLLASALGCIAFGILLLFNVHPIGDGLWFWYARLTIGGSKLYSDLHFPLQPLFVLLTASFQRAFGISWLASKILPLVQLVGYTTVLLLIVSKAQVPPLVQALLLPAVLGLTINTSFYRFDDYHITSDLVGASCLLLLLGLHASSSGSAILWRAAGLGALCGLSLGNRLNDGATLTIGCLIAFPFLAPKQRRIGTLLLALLAPSTFALVILATGDSFHSWYLTSVVRAAEIKGGSGNVLLYPLTLPVRLFTSYIGWQPLQVLSNLAVLTMACAYLYRRYRSYRQSAHRTPKGFWTAWTVAAAVVAVLSALYFSHQSRDNLPLLDFSHLADLALYSAGLWVAFRALLALFHRPPAGFHPVEVLLLLPLGQLIAGSMTSAETLPDLMPPFAFAFLLLPFVLPRARLSAAVPWIVGISIGVCLTSVIAKVFHPYTWSTYASRRMFNRRVWYRHPIYGPMLIEDDQLSLLQQTCSAIRSTPAPNELLSLPYPYANYFCGITPWHGYVQTWYDTSSRFEIAALEQELQTAPPQWILYQHNTQTIRLHEIAFAQGGPIAHRSLDRQISLHLRSASWQLVQRTCLNNSDWLLIRTKPGNVADPIQKNFIDHERDTCAPTFLKIPW